LFFGGEEEKDYRRDSRGAAEGAEEREPRSTPEWLGLGDKTRWLRS
jgi:hypothetical protein